MTLYLPSLFIQSGPNQLIFVSLDENVLKGKCFADMQEVKQETTEALKGIKTESSKIVWGSGKHVSVVILFQMESPLKVTEHITCILNI